MKHFILLLFLACLAFAACEENGTDPDDDDNGTDRLDTTTVVANDWSITELQQDGDAQTVGDQDNIAFQSNGDYILVIPEMSFFPASGTWELSDDQKTIIINDGDYELEIISISDNEMVLELNYENFKADSITYRITLVKNTTA